jgi:hypothetical protein
MAQTAAVIFTASVAHIATPQKGLGSRNRLDFGDIHAICA